MRYSRSNYRPGYSGLAQASRCENAPCCGCCPMTSRERAIHGAAWVLILAGIVTMLTLAAMLPASAAVTGRAQTCAAFHAYQAHPTGGRLVTVVVDSTHLGKSYLRADVGQWWADESSPSPKAAKYVAKDLGYIADNCKVW